MPPHLPVYIGPDALAELTRFCRTQGLDKLTLVADRNTYAALGERAEAALRGQGCDVLTVLLEADDIIADAHSVMQVLLALDRTPRTYLAVGSGTITDVTRFVSHRTGREFISLPTAPSVDGYTSIGAPMAVDGVKLTVAAHGPLAVFADLPTLCAAPRPLTAAGFGDMLAKFTSTADWELGSLLWGEPFDAAIAARSRKATWACAEKADAIAAASEEGVAALMVGLIESGFCMLDFGETRPASGYEHHISHFWEMKLLREGRHSVLHGAKVGIGVLVSARRYDAVRRMSRAEAATRVSRTPLPDREAQIRGIRAAYGLIAEQVIAIQAPFLEMTTADFEALKRKTLASWDAIQRVAATVPPAVDIEGWLRRAGGPVAGREVGLSDDEVTLGVAFGHYYRNRFTIGKLSGLLGIA
ncbi:MAG: sn-glycerol-1-phosphate dehydrogenase [Chloroflexi bacterium]|nr:sn-glycerol-1-phosphate dehydrogenase [Chloroflexota bacterium]